MFLFLDDNILDVAGCIISWFVFFFPPQPTAHSDQLFPPACFVSVSFSIICLCHTFVFLIRFYFQSTTSSLSSLVFIFISLYFLSTTSSMSQPVSCFSSVLFPVYNIIYVAAWSCVSESVLFPVHNIRYVAPCNCVQFVSSFCLHHPLHRRLHVYSVSILVHNIFYVAPM